MTRPSVRCCDPTWRPFPSGWSWAHARTCSESPNQKIRLPGQRQARHLHAVHEAETRSKGVATREPRQELDVTEPHPACVTAAADGGIPCSRCAWLLNVPTAGAAYFDAHTDDGR